MNSTKTQIAVIGAGIAGLGAARVLTASGYAVLVLEARNRFGGRIWPDHSLGVPLSRGAAWVHGIHNNPIISLAEQFSTPYFSFSGPFHTYDRDGQLISAQEIADFSLTMESALQQTRTLALQQPQDISLATALSAIVNPGDWSAVPQDLFARQLRFFENYIGAEYECLSARHWDEEEEKPEHAILADGYAAIINGLADSCHVQLNTVVRMIRERKNDMEIVTDQGNIYADATIVTVPLGVLKQQNVVFEPALSRQKQAAIDRIGMGLFNILTLRFPAVFWPEAAGALFPPPNSPFSVFFNMSQFLKVPVLLGYTGGKTGRMLEVQPDSQILTQALAQLKTMFGSNVSSPESYFLTRWSQDPYSHGSYSYLGVGASGEDRDILAQPASRRLFFAGEATHRQFPATTHGAYLSGLREAERIKNLRI